MPESDGYYTEALQEWTDILGNLWIAIGKPVDIPRLQIYARKFQHVPMGLLELVVSRLLRETTYQVVPTIAEVHRALHAELQAANCEAPEDWTNQKCQQFMERARIFFARPSLNT